MKIAVVTGASSGIGAEFVSCLDKDERFDEIWVIARRQSRLENIQAKAKVRAVPMDLTCDSSFYEYERLLQELQPEVAVLVNAGGFGYFGSFKNYGREFLVTCIRYESPLYFSTKLFPICIEDIC